MAQLHERWANSLLSLLSLAVSSGQRHTLFMSLPNWALFVLYSFLCEICGETQSTEKTWLLLSISKSLWSCQWKSNWQVLSARGRLFKSSSPLTPLHSVTSVTSVTSEMSLKWGPSRGHSYNLINLNKWIDLIVLNINAFKLNETVKHCVCGDWRWILYVTVL